MKKFLVNTIWAVGGIALALFCLSACTRELDVQQAYDFSLEVMPVQNSIAKGETAEIRCSLKRSGRFAYTQYTIRYFQPDGKGYFQPDGKGCLKMDDGTIFKPNDRYPLTRDTFRLYYTSLSTDRQTIDIYVEDNFGQLQQQTFNFNNEDTITK
ncbi:DUF3872 domain-containing protein [uncultured Porphyromonas sp.]|jgi:hypothetical protein|uniref:DUF3872 domain-containing protein n=1 Tax=uncultured Porphyromonas sp. TaxID=159274 RepID=UPI00262A11FE|nr:DUF3872 domain-containing protein [uncultured Porphyromonas sp.]